MQLKSENKQLESENKQLESENRQLESEKIVLQRDQSKAIAEETERKNRISPLQRDQMTKLLDSGSRVNSAVTDGVSLQNFRILHAEFNGAVALVVANWPSIISKETKEKLQKSAECLSFSQEIWGLKIEYGKTFSGFFVSDTPIPEPLKSLIKIQEYKSPDGRVLEQGPWGSMQIGLTVGSALFESAQAEILTELNR